MDTLRDRRRQDERAKVAERAAEWLILLEENEPEARAAFAEWIEESPLHVEMFLRATAVSHMGELVGPANCATLVHAVRSAGDPQAVPMRGASVPSGAVFEPEARNGRPRLLQWCAAVAAAAVLACVGWYFSAHYSWLRYATSVGEQRVVPLEDGSTIYLNTDTQIRVVYSDKEREVRMSAGEASFKVAPDPSRPFRVHIGNAVVQAVGTEFNIYKRPTQTTITVVEGAVRVSDRVERLTAGHALSLPLNGRAGAPVAVDVTQITAWRQRRLIFEWQTLESIAAEFNRYNRAPQIRVEGDSTRARRYTAVFDADNPQALLKFLAKDPDLTFAAVGGDFVIRGD
jgi:transmembrane sensor